ncbi:Clp protease N-terminal domain-containing protein [Streptomyces sp. NPDC004749]
MATAAFGPVPADSERPLSPHTEQIVARGRLLAAEQGDDSSFGTVHVLAALLDDEGGEAAALLREEGVDVAALRERLPRRPGA